MIFSYQIVFYVILRGCTSFFTASAEGFGLGSKEALGNCLMTKNRPLLCHIILVLGGLLCLYKVELNDSHILSYLEYLITQGVSVNMLANNISACRAKFVMNGLHFALWDHPNVRYMLKSVKINRPIVITRKNIIDL